MNTYFMAIDEKKWKDLHDEEKYIQVTIDGKKACTKADVFGEFGKQLQFPTPCKNYSGFSDWLMDLSWHPAGKGVCIVIENYSSLLADEPEEKETIMDILCNELIDFWKIEVEKVVKGGKTREVVVLITE